MNIKSRTEALAELASNGRFLDCEMLELGYLRQLVADKEKAVLELEILPPQRKAISNQELSGQTREFLRRFLTDRGALL